MKKQCTIFLILIFILGLVPINFSEAITQNQINSEVQIVCTDGADNWFSGSGTIIDPKGIILTNKHVVDGAYKNICFIGFLDSINKDPNFGPDGNPNLAEVKYITTTKDMDAAVLYLDNKNNKIYPYVNIWNSNSGNLKFGDKIEVVGYPGIGGSTITYTSGDFSGFGSQSDGTHNYIKTTALLEHGNSGGSAYNQAGEFVGIPSMVVTGSLNSISYVLSVDSIKRWLSGFLGSDYKQEIIEQQPIITEQPKIDIQNDITPPYQQSFFVGFTGYNEKGEWAYYGQRYGDSKAAIYEFPKIRFVLSEFSDGQGSVKGYYYYFGEDPLAVPKEVGKYIATANLICDKYCNLIPELFSVSAGKSNYLIVQAVDQSGNISNPLINFQYIYEPDKFKDIKSFDIRTAENKLLGNLKYPLLKESPGCQAIGFCSEGRILDYTVKTIYTNQDALFLYPNYGYEINGLTYYLSYGDDRWWTDKARAGKTTLDKFIKISNIKSKGSTNIFLKPFKDGVNSFFGKHFILQVIYKNSVSGVAVANNDPDPHYSTQYRALLKFTAMDEILINRLKGYLLLQTESSGEAWYLNPADSKRYYMKDGAVAYQMMRNFGLGITNVNLAKIPKEGEKNINSYFVDRLKGKILLQIESHGEAWYIDPKSGYRYYLKDGEAAYILMRFHSLGITNNDLSKIPEGSL